MIFLRRNNGNTSQSITAPEQLEAASDLKFHLLEIKNMKNFGPTPKLV
jgi:hypothetical protein